MIINVYQSDNKLESYNLADLISSDYVESFSFLVGRSSECRIVLPDQKVSRSHCEILYKNKKWYLNKISKYADVKIDGKDINEAELIKNCSVSIGPYDLQIEMPEKVQDSKAEENNEKPENDEVMEVSPSSDDLSYPDEVEANDEGESIDDLEDGTTEFLGTDELEEPNGENLSDDEFQTESESFDEAEEYAADEYDENEYTDEGQGDEYSEEFDDGGFAMEESAGEKTQVFTGFADYDLEIFGEFAPYDRFSIKEGETTIGRDEKSVDIFLNDSEVSSKHAKIIKTKISLRVVDLNSANGTLLNGSRVNESDLQSGDEFIIGSTTFTVHIRSDMISNEKDRLLPVEENQIVEVEEIVEVDEGIEEVGETASDAEPPKSLIGKFKALPPKKQKIYGAVGLLLIFLLLDSEEPKQVNTPTKKPNAEKIADNKDPKGAVKKGLKNSLEKLTLQEREVVASKYQLAFEFIQQGKYSESLSELDYVMKLAPDYKQARSLYQMAREGLAKLEELEKKRIAEVEAKKRQEKIDKLIVSAQKYVKERQVQAAEGVFSKILEIDPENFDVPQLKLEINAWKKEQERIAMEKAQKDADRKRKLSQISASRTFYGKEEWYKAILKVEEFLRIKDMDEDLVKEATEMLKVSKANLKNKIGPMIGKARSLKEGQDLKAAYEQYLGILDHEPTNVEALDEMNEIRDILTLRSQKVYRDGLISESLMLFKEAKEKFQEVQQISPSDSDYYKKASLKLREYLE